MNIDALLEKLLATARAQPPEDSVPYAFEKRIMARLAAPPVLDLWSWWSRLLWRAAAPCVGLTLVLGVWTFVSTPAADEAGIDLESTVLATVDNPDDAW